VLGIGPVILLFIFLASAGGFLYLKTQSKEKKKA